MSTKLKSTPVVFKSSGNIPVTFNTSPEDMTSEELMTELLNRTEVAALRAEAIEQKHLIRELEVHQLELELQNRHLVESYRENMEVKRKYVDLYDFAPVGYLSLNRKGTIIDLNLTTADLLGLSKKQATGKNLSRWLIHEDKPRLSAHFADCFARKIETLITEMEIKNDRGETLLLEARSTMATDSELETSVIKMAVIDVSDRKKLRKVEAESKFLKEEQELRERLITTFSHELRTPLVSTKLCAQMLDSAIHDIEKRKQLYQLMVEELERADGMVRELLDASRATGGKNLPLILKKSDLAQIIRKCLSKLGDLYGDNVKINLRAEGDFTGQWSRDGIIRIIENLVSNAVKYGQAEYPITISLEDKGHGVKLTVHNYGSPIPMKEQKKIFEAFHRSTNARKSEKIGWGLGLSLVHMIVERHQGQIVVTSTLEEGTSFIIDLPKSPQ